MRYFKYLGVLAAAGLVACSFLPWVHIASRNLFVYGMHPGTTNYGRPGLMHLLFTALFLGLLWLRPLWTRRVNLFLQAFNVAWAFRNLLLIGACSYGECPEKLAALYALPVLTLLMLLAVLLQPETAATRAND